MKENEELEQLNLPKLREYVSKESNWHGKFSLQAKEPLPGYFDGYGYVEFEKPREEFWCRLWTGPHCLFGTIELIPYRTIVTGTVSEPIFFTPREVTELFIFSDKNPLNNQKEPEGTPYWHGLMHIKRRIREFAKEK